jgi:hypothetical protein
MAHFINETLDAGNTESAIIDWPGGPGTAAAQGNFGSVGTTIKIQFQIDGSNWTDVPGNDLTFISNDLGNFMLFPCKLKAVLTVSGSPSVKVRVAPAWQGWFLGTTLPDTE